MAQITFSGPRHSFPRCWRQVACPVLSCYGIYIQWQLSVGHKSLVPLHKRNNAVGSSPVGSAEIFVVTSSQIHFSPSAYPCSCHPSQVSQEHAPVNFPHAIFYHSLFPLELNLRHLACAICLFLGWRQFDRTIANQLPLLLNDGCLSFCFHSMWV